MPRQRAAIVGVGYSTVGRRTGLPWQELVVQAVEAAMADAGLERADIDGMTTLGGDAIADAAMMGIGPLNWYDRNDSGPAFVQPATQAAVAVEAGQAHTVVATRIIKRGGMAPAAEANRAMALPTTLAGDIPFLFYYGAAAGPPFAALMTRRHMAEYGTTEEQFGAHVVAQRQFATLNDEALIRDPLTLDGYLSSRYVCKPLRVLDCDYPCDAGAAVIFTTEERARDLARPPVLVEAYAMSAMGEPDFENLPDLTNYSGLDCAKKLWSRTDLAAEDVDCAQLYDGFTITAFEWLEALGFCERGGAGPFVEEGNTAMGGRLPLNTDGGACNVGRRHGANFCIEATRQLRGEAGPRQAPGAEVAVWANAAGYFTGAMLLTRG